MNLATYQRMMVGIPRTIKNAAGFTWTSMKHGIGRSITIEAHTTPNVNSLKFHPGQPVFLNGTRDFPTSRAAASSPLAAAIFRIHGISNVFFGADFVTVTKTDSLPWENVKPAITDAITEFFTSGEPIVVDEGETYSEIDEDKSEVVMMIKEILDARIRPSVQDDGGDVALVSFDPDSGVVAVRLQGACASCSSSKATLKDMVENMLMHYIPEVKEVIAIENPEAAAAAAAKEAPGGKAAAGRGPGGGSYVTPAR
uniref:Scaffold protein Nfu/NifU N-terminal domain-containing protein n=1 Tax=Cryptomonas curvata TaxID=233186 RepID=A0A7S0QJU0_9CRYP|mmetsp:Transcript_30244/g.63327  ORF Transcript_30244/g.63327 Transcript_30244/m.63327 type:complete len:255 (+) Transcript_30244:28-792(+)